MSDAPLQRFLGGSPLGVALRLLVVSLLVGAFMVWQGIHPADFYKLVESLLRNIWNLGLHSFRDFGEYLLAGAAVVVPIWLLMRLLNWRRKP